MVHFLAKFYECNNNVNIFLMQQMRDIDHKFSL